jgi:hypothetical protein
MGEQIANLDIINKDENSFGSKVSKKSGGCLEGSIEKKNIALISIGNSMKSLQGSTVLKIPK